MQFVKLKEKRPFMYKGIATWYNAGEVMELHEEKLLPCFKMPFYKIGFKGFFFDGWQNSDDFEKIN